MPITGEKKVLVGMTEILHARLHAWAKGNAMSMSEAFVEGARLLLDGPPPNALGVPPLTNKVAVERLGPDPKVGFGLDPAKFLANKVSIAPATLVPGAVPQSLTGESDLQTNDDTQRAEFIRIFGRQALEMGLKMPSFRKAGWPQRFEIAEGKRERGE